MSKHNKVNPGQYTQAGRLTPDDTARELVKQRDMASPRHVEGGDYSQKIKSRATTEDNSDNNSDSEENDIDDGQMTDEEENDEESAEPEEA